MMIHIEYSCIYECSLQILYTFIMNIHFYSFVCLYLINCPYFLTYHNFCRYIILASSLCCFAMKFPGYSWLLCGQDEPEKQVKSKMVLMGLRGKSNVSYPTLYMYICMYTYIYTCIFIYIYTWCLWVLKVNQMCLILYYF
jgi:hypothetical protein